jgi:hypothetical protein
MTTPEPANPLNPLWLDPADLRVQAMIRLPLPIVVGNRDYAQREGLLRRMDELLKQSGVEAEFVAQAVRQAKGTPDEVLSDRRLATIQRFARQSLRCPIARILSGESHRSFSTHVAESALLQWFCGCDRLDRIQVPSKSTLQRMESELPQGLLERLNVRLLESASAVDDAGQSTLGLAAPVDRSVVWMDATCAKLNIHYPTDWTLLRDATRTIVSAIVVIRKHGLKHKMPDPKSFTAQMNQLAMAMSGASRRGRGGDKAKARKRALRAMKTVVRKVEGHGQRYLELLTAEWATTDLSQAQAQVIIDRLRNVLEQLPHAIHQAHERIIGERALPNDQKLHSLYEPHAQVYVRGKANADVEFGLQLLLSETAEGLIIDCHLIDGPVANDSTLLVPALARIRADHGDTAATTVVTDRGFTSYANSQRLGESGITDATLPRSPAAMAEFLADPKNRELQTRRAQTEARIGIFKANFLGDHLPTKGIDHQKRFIAWATLAHNLWVLARLSTVERQQKAA